MFLRRNCSDSERLGGELTFRLTAGGRLSKSTVSIAGICDLIFGLAGLGVNIPAVQQDIGFIDGRRELEDRR